MSDPIKPLIWPYKDPDERMVFGIKWSVRLAGDTIASSVWLTPSGSLTLTMDTPTFSDTETKVWVSGGAVGDVALCTNRVTTVAGAIMDETCRLEIRVR